MKRKLEAAVVDSSALICIAKGEPAANSFLNEMGNADKLYISAATHAEVILATMSLQAEGAVDAMEGLIATLKIETVDFGGDDIQAYKDAAMKHHLKAKPSGPLNMGDVFSFQLAMKMNLPLFFQGKDFFKDAREKRHEDAGIRNERKESGRANQAKPNFGTVIISSR